MITIKYCSTVTIDNSLTNTFGENVIIEGCSDVHLTDEPIDDDVPFGNLDMIEDEDEDNSAIDINEKFTNLFLDKDSETDEDECMCGGMTNHECTDMKEVFSKKDTSPYVSDSFSLWGDRNQQKQELFDVMVDQFLKDYGVKYHLSQIIFRRLFDIMDILAIGKSTPPRHICDKRLANVETVDKDMFNYVTKIQTLYDPKIIVTKSYGPHYVMAKINHYASKNGLSGVLAVENVRMLLNDAVYRLAHKKIHDIISGIFGNYPRVIISIDSMFKDIELILNSQNVTKCIDQNSGKHYFDGYTEKGCIAELVSMMYPTVKRKNINKYVTRLFDTLKK